MVGASTTGTAPRRGCARATRLLSLSIALLLLAGGITACQRASVGARCRTTDFGDDGGDWVLQCRNGRWQRMLTKQRVAEIVIAAQASNPDRVAAGSIAPHDDYPAAWRNAAISSANDFWGFPNRQCTSFLAWRLHQASGYTVPPNLGDAAAWDDRLAPLARVDQTPAVGAIAQWNANESAGGLGAGPLGHLGWVQAVYADGSVMIEQYNLGSTGQYAQLRTRARATSTSAISDPRQSRAARSARRTPRAPSRITSASTPFVRYANEMPVAGSAHATCMCMPACPNERGEHDCPNPAYRMMWLPSSPAITSPIERLTASSNRGSGRVQRMFPVASASTSGRQRPAGSWSRPW